MIYYCTDELSKTQGNRTCITFKPAKKKEGNFYLEKQKIIEKIEKEGGNIAAEGSDYIIWYDVSFNFKASWLAGNNPLTENKMII